LLLAGVSLLSGVSLVVPLLAGVPRLVGVPLLVGTRWGALSGFVSELPVVPADVVGLQSVVGGAAEAVPGVRAVAVSGM